MFGMLGQCDRDNHRLRLFDAFFRRGEVTHHALVSLSRAAIRERTGIADDARQERYALALRRRRRGVGKV